MEILQKRIANVQRNGRKYCISRIYVNGEYECDAIEDYDRGLNQSMSLQEILKRKVMNETAIPVGTYKLTLSVRSPKFSQKEYYRTFCNGYLPRLMDVKGYQGILIHRGTNEASSSGCIIVGENKIIGAVINSQKCFESLYKKLKSSQSEITWKIQRSYNI